MWPRLRAAPGWTVRPLICRVSGRKPEAAEPVESSSLFSLQSRTLGFCQIDFPLAFFFLTNSFPGRCRKATSRALRITKKGPGFLSPSANCDSTSVLLAEEESLPAWPRAAPPALHAPSPGPGQCCQAAVAHAEVGHPGLGSVPGPFAS